MDPRIEKMSKKERNDTMVLCQHRYVRDYKAHYPDLPDFLEDIESKDINSMIVIEEITGKHGIMVELLRLKRTFDAVSK